jgi:hydroxyethylthiazole kinase-like sugar kinase family protein
MGGNNSYKSYLIDAVYHFSKEDIIDMSKISED